MTQGMQKIRKHGFCENSIENCGPQLTNFGLEYKTRSTILFNRPYSIVLNGGVFTHLIRAEIELYDLK
jgi:hypothetical protein